MRLKATEKNIQNPLASLAVESDTRRMEDVGSEIATEEAPEWTVRGRANVVLVGRDDLAQGRCRRTVGEESAVFKKSFMSNGAVGNEDDGVIANGEGDDRAIFGDETAKKRFNLERGSAEP